MNSPKPVRSGEALQSHVMPLMVHQTTAIELMLNPIKYSDLPSHEGVAVAVWRNKTTDVRINDEKTINEIQHEVKSNTNRRDIKGSPFR